MRDGRVRERDISKIVLLEALGDYQSTSMTDSNSDGDIHAADEADYSTRDDSDTEAANEAANSTRDNDDIHADDFARNDGDIHADDFARNDGDIHAADEADDFNCDDDGGFDD